MKVRVNNGVFDREFTYDLSRDRVGSIAGKVLAALDNAYGNGKLTNMKLILSTHKVGDLVVVLPGNREQRESVIQRALSRVL